MARKKKDLKNPHFPHGNPTTTGRGSIHSAPLSDLGGLPSPPPRRPSRRAPLGVLHTHGGHRGFHRRRDRLERPPGPWVPTLPRGAGWREGWRGAGAPGSAGPAVCGGQPERRPLHASPSPRSAPLVTLWAPQSRPRASLCRPYYEGKKRACRAAFGVERLINVCF